jgi:DNA polymerase I-like protein with 3'-5' exonuclease and polymerase domains
MILVCLDFETEAIANRPEYPPKPVGISMKVGEGKSIYYAWGHPTGNNYTEEDAINNLKSLIEEACYHFIFHNAAFDMAIIEEKWGLHIDWKRIHCTMVLAFLTDPHGELALKPLCEKLFSLPPIERDAVKDWLVEQGICRAKQKDWGAHISKAPGDLVKPYAEGDTDRTYMLFTTLYQDWLQEPYSREMALMPHIMAMERHGVRVDMAKLTADIGYYEEQLAALDDAIIAIVGPVDIDSSANLADAIELRGLAGKGFSLTEKGNRSVSKESIINAISDPQLLGHILCRRAIATSLRTFLLPWHEAAQKTGRMYIRWNQVRNYSDTGARTGRLSSSPNMQAIPVLWENLLAQLEKIGYTLTFKLPSVRSYIIPDEGNIFISRDYSAQELRLLAHFTGGKLLAQLQQEPEADVHMIAANIAGISRKVAKTLGFAVLYGAGMDKLAQSLQVPPQIASMIKTQYLAALPEINALQNNLKWIGRSGQYLTTLGGRRYYTEQPAFRDGRLRTFEYKLTNYLIQGSAADQTKEAMVEFLQRTSTGKLVLSVHDELVIECPIEHQAEEAALLAKCMNSSFQNTLEYQIISTEACGHSFAEV